jgi:DNA-binding CsgD family transcriptional regulator
MDGSECGPVEGQPFPPVQPTADIDFIYIPLFKSESFLRQKYLEEGLSTRQIALEIFSSRSTVAAHMKKFGIPLRAEDVAHKMNKGRLAYGERRPVGQMAIHKREAEVIAKMQELRRQGYSYWKIADILTTMKVPTKTRRARWAAATVMKILKAADANPASLVDEELSLSKQRS